MTVQDTTPEEEFEDEFEESEEYADDSQEPANEAEEDDGEPRKPSLIKKLRDELKAAKKEAAELKKKGASEVKLSASKENEIRLFVLENPEAKDFKDGIKAAQAKFPDMSLEEALAFAKATAPKVSETKRDFDLRSKSKPADIMNMDDDEAAEKLSPSEYLKYSRAKGSQFLKPSFQKR